MKKTLFILVFISTCLNTYAGEIHGNLEIGKETNVNRYYSQINLNYNFTLWRLKNRIYGGWETWFVVNDNLSGNPFRDIYTLGYKIQCGIFYGKFEHFCNHPVYSKYNENWFDENLETGGTFNTYTIGIEW